MHPYQRRANIRVEDNPLPPAFLVATCSMKVVEGAVIATAKLVGKAGADMCKITLSIQRKTASKWTSIKSWPVTEEARSASIKGMLDAVPGDTYRAIADMVITVSGESTSVTKTSNTITA